MRMYEITLGVEKMPRVSFFNRNMNYCSYFIVLHKGVVLNLFSLFFKATLYGSNVDNFKSSSKCPISLPMSKLNIGIVNVQL